MTKLDWERKGPPLPGSGAVAHPPAIERPYVHVTEEQRRRRREALKAEAQERGRAIKAAEWDARFGKRFRNPYRD